VSWISFQEWLILDLEESSKQSATFLDAPEVRMVSGLDYFETLRQGSRLGRNARPAA
jgi:hypothetical protein